MKVRRERRGIPKRDEDSLRFRHALLNERIYRTHIYRHMYKCTHYMVLSVSVLNVFAV